MPFSSYIIIICALLVFYSIGRLTLASFSLETKQQNSNKYYTAFVSLIIGTYVTITVYAIYKTNFNTILIGLCLLILSFLILSRKKIKLKNPFLWQNSFDVYSLLKQVSLIFVLSFCLFVLFGLFFYDKPFNNIPHGDYYFYARLINSIGTTGHETTFLVGDANFSGPVGATPYHYPEMWLSYLFVDLFGILPLESIVIYSQIIFATILCFGIIALASEFSKNNIVYILGIISLFFSGLLIINILPQASSFIDFGSIYTPKYSAISIFLVWGIILMIRKSELFYLPFLTLPIINIALAPSILSSLSIFYIFNAFYKKDKNKFIIPFLITLIISIFIAMFYFFQPKLPVSNLGISEIIDVNLKFPKTIINVFLGGIVIFLSLFIWYFLPILFLGLRSFRNIINKRENGIFSIVVFWIILFFVSLIIWSVSNPMHDSVQFHYLPAYLFTNIIVFIFLALVLILIKNRNKILQVVFYLYLAIIIIINFLQIKDRAFFKYSSISDFYSYKYLENIADIISKQDDIVTIGKLSPTIKVKTSFDSNTYWNVMPPLDNLVSNFQIVSLNSNDYIYLTNDYKTIVRSQKNFDAAPFSRYCKSNQANGTKSIDELRLKYMQENNIIYLIVTNSAQIPVIFKPFILYSYFDSVSGESFCVLNYE